MPAERWQRWLFLAWPLLLVLVAGFLADDRLKPLLLATCRISLGTLLIAIPAGTFLAVAFLRTNLCGRQFAAWLLPPLLMMPLVIHVAAWETLFGKLGWFTLRNGELNMPWLSGESAAILIHGIAAIPWAVLFASSGLRYVQQEWEEIALLREAWPSVLLKITLPALLPYLTAASVWIFITTAGEMTVTNIYMLRTFSEEIYTAFALRESWGEMLRLLISPLLIFSACAMSLWQLLPKSEIEATSSRLGFDQPLFALGRMRWPLSIGCWFLVGCLILVPCGSLLSRVGMEVIVQPNGDRLRQWSAVKSCELVCQAPGRYAAELTQTMLISAAAASVAVSAMLLLIGGLPRERRAWQLLLLLVPLALPGPLVGLLVIALLNRPEDPTGVLIWCYDQTILPPVLALLPRVCPVAGLILWAAIRSTPRELWDTASLFAPNRFAALSVVVRGYLWPAVIASWLAAFVLAAGDVACTILVLPPGVSTISFRIFGLLHSGCDDQVAAISLLQLFCTFGIGMGVARLLRSQGNATAMSSSSVERSVGRGRL